MATTKRTKLNSLYRQWAPGTPLTSEDLTELGVSADLAVHYARAGWPILEFNTIINTKPIILEFA